MKNKRILSLVLAFAMILGTFSFAFATPSDVVDTEYEDAVNRLMSLDVLTGYPDGSFRPEDSITRAEFAAVAVRVKGMEAVAEAAKGFATGFTDVPANHWASGYVGTAAKLGIVEGVGNNKFNPEAPVKYEEAITMLVRALGYEPAAKEKGGYPFGYLLVANEIDLLENAKGVQGLPASRGFVAQITDNALETAMMIQVGYGPGAKWVVSGTEDTKVKTLLDEMGFAHVEGLVESVNVSKNTITVDGKTLKVEDKNFDYNYAEGMQVKAWYKGNALVTYAVTKEALVGVAGVVEGSKGEIEVAGDDYDVARGATLVLNGKKVDAEEFKADYAKVALNADNEIVWAKGYTLKYMIVEEVDENDVFDYEGYDINVKGYVLLKDGRTIDVEDIEKEDVLAYNRDAKFAMVYNDSVVGEIERVYTTEFRFEGEVYDIQGFYLDGDVFGELDKDVLADMMAEEEDVKVFFNTKGEVVLVKGSLGEDEVTNSFYALVLNSKPYTEKVRGEDKNLLYLQVRTEEGKKVEYDIAEGNKKDEDDNDVSHFAGLEFIVEEKKVVLKDELKDAVLKVTVDEDGDLTKLAVVKSHEEAVKVELDKTYVEGYRLQDSTVVFYEGGDKAVKLEDAKFTEVNEAKIYYEKGRVVAVVGKADDTDLEYVDGLVTKVRKLKGGTYELTLFGGDRYETEKVFTTDKVEEDKNKDIEDYEGLVAELGIVKKSGKVKTVKEMAIVKDAVISERTARTIKTDKGNYELVSGAKLYDVTGGIAKAKEIRALDLAEKDEITVYFDDAKTEVFVKYVLRTDVDKKEGPKDPELPEGAVKYGGKVELDGNLYILLDGETYPVDKNIDLTGVEEDDLVIPTFVTIRGEKVVAKVEKVVKVSNKEELKNALTTAVVKEITIEGTIGSDEAYTVYNVNRPVTIKGGADAKVFGTFIVEADDVTIKDLAIQNKGDSKGESTTNRGGIYVFANNVTLTNNTITNGLGENEGLSNAIQIMSPTENNPLSNYVITGNKLIGHDNKVANWSSSGIVIAQGYKPGSIGQDVLAITATVDDYQNLLDNNTFTSNKIDLTHQDWSKSGDGIVLYVYLEQKTDE